MKTSKKNLGNLGEDTACDFLCSKGHTVLDRNWRSGHQEIDIISLDAAGLHFVEVKSRTIPFQTEPQEAIDANKQKQLTKAATAYLKKKDLPKDCPEVFFDAVSVVFEGELTRVEWFPQIFVPMYFGR